MDVCVCIYIHTHVYVKLQFGRFKTRYLCSKLALHFSPQHRARTLRKYRCVSKLHFWSVWGYSHVARSRSAGCTVAKHGSGSTRAAATLQTSWRTLQKLCTEPLASAFQFQVPYHSLAHILSLAESLGGCMRKLCKAWLNTRTSAPCMSGVQDEPRQILSHAVAFGVVTTLRHMERGQLPDQLSFPCLIS